MNRITEIEDISPKYINHLQTYYTTVLSHQITTDGKFLIAAIKNNQIAVFPIQKYLIDINNESHLEINNNSLISKLNRPKPISSFPVDNSLCLCFLDQTNSRYKFALGGEGSIKGYKLSTENIQECEEEWTIKLAIDTTMANAIILMKNQIIAGCGDNHIYIYDQETRQLVSKLLGHRDYIHDLKCTNDHSILYSSSEDGLVLGWDIRSPNRPISSLCPYKINDLKRSQFGRWIGTIDVSSNKDWLLCGGGPSLSIWHLRSQKCAHIIETPSVVYAAQFLSDHSKVVAAGGGNIITVWKGSDPTSLFQISSSIATIYSISHHFYEHLNYDLLSFGGDSYQIEICENEKFIDWKLFVS